MKRKYFLNPFEIREEGEERWVYKYYRQTRHFMWIRTGPVGCESPSEAGKTAHHSIRFIFRLKRKKVEALRCKLVGLFAQTNTSRPYLYLFSGLEKEEK
jgi:hypothetical protein